MDRQFAFVIKEEILRNVLKTHGVALVIGRPGTGKTATALKAGLALGNVCYLNGTGSKASAVPFVEGATVLKDLKDFEGLGRADTLLIVDETHKLGDIGKEALNELLSSTGKTCKIILITPVVMDAKDFIAFADVVVRFRPDTAEMLVSNLRDIHKA